MSFHVHLEAGCKDPLALATLLSCAYTGYYNARYHNGSAVFEHPPLIYQKKTLEWQVDNLLYIVNNPVVAGLCKSAGGYRYSSYDFYTDRVTSLSRVIEVNTSLMHAVQAYLDAGMPAYKLVLGIPFYGRHSFSDSPQVYEYKDIVKLSTAAGYKIDNWDSSAYVPYVTLNGTYYCGYDNAKSIAAKGHLAIGDKGMKGMMYWHYDGDNARGTLRKAVWSAVMKKY